MFQWILKILMAILGRFSWEKVIELLLEFGYKWFLKWVEGNEISARAIMAVQCVYLVAVTLGREWAGDTQFKTDDELVNKIELLATQMAERFGFPLPKLG